jgi:hypothetical protein
MEVDALNSSHPVSTPVENPAQIREMFDDVSYEKVKVDCKGTVRHYMYQYWDREVIRGQPRLNVFYPDCAGCCKLL